jgi:hypothetical protein
MSSIAEAKRAPGEHPNVREADSLIRRVLGSPMAVAESLGMVPALSILMLSLVGAVVVAVTQSHIDAPVAWMTLVIATLLSAGPGLGRRRTRTQ